MMFVSGWVEENWQRQGLAFGRAEAPSARRFIGTAEAVPLSKTRFFSVPVKPPIVAGVFAGLKRCAPTERTTAITFSGASEVLALSQRQKNQQQRQQQIPTG
jgi:hypothetical protein